MILLWRFSISKTVPPEAPSPQKQPEWCPRWGRTAGCLGSGRLTGRAWARLGAGPRRPAAGWGAAPPPAGHRGCAGGPGPPPSAAAPAPPASGAAALPPAASGWGSTERAGRWPLRGDLSAGLLGFLFLHASGPMWETGFRGWPRNRKRLPRVSHTELRYGPGPSGRSARTWFLGQVTARPWNTHSGRPRLWPLLCADAQLSASPAGPGLLWSWMRNCRKKPSADSCASYAVPWPLKASLCDTLVAFLRPVIFLGYKLLWLFYLDI